MFSVAKQSEVRLYRFGLSTLFFYIKMVPYVLVLALVSLPFTIL